MRDDRRKDHGCSRPDQNRVCARELSHMHQKKARRSLNLSVRTAANKCCGSQQCTYWQGAVKVSPLQVAHDVRSQRVSLTAAIRTETPSVSNLCSISLNSDTRRTPRTSATLTSTLQQTVFYLLLLHEAHLPLPDFRILGAQFESTQDAHMYAFSSENKAQTHRLGHLGVPI